MSHPADCPASAGFRLSGRMVQRRAGIQKEKQAHEAAQQHKGQHVAACRRSVVWLHWVVALRRPPNPF